MARYTGKAGSMTWNGTTIPITEVSHKVSKTMADATDSSNFDVVTNQLFKTQLPGDNQLTLTAKGYFNSATTPGNIYVAMLADATVSVITRIEPSTKVVTGTFDVSDWESTVTVPGGTMVEWTATLMSNGSYTLGG